MVHYICTGTCKGVSDVPKKCGDMTCTRYDQELIECDCADGKHYGRQDAHTHRREELEN